jgi:hypothetical protein
MTPTASDCTRVFRLSLARRNAVVGNQISRRAWARPADNSGATPHTNCRSSTTTTTRPSKRTDGSDLRAVASSGQRQPQARRVADLGWPLGPRPPSIRTGSLKSPPPSPAFLNGVIVQNHFALKGETLYIGKPFHKAFDAAPIKLQAPQGPDRAHQLQGTSVRTNSNCAPRRVSLFEAVMPDVSGRHSQAGIVRSSKMPP